MSLDNSTNERIRSFIVQKFPAARKRTLDDNVPLIASGIVDSMGVLDVVTFLEKSFSIRLADDELTPDNFATINCISAFVARKKGQTGIAAD
jgi:acyl carrier protein